ncbi:hypothetical protein RYX36_022732 [Vicia faba]
MLDKSTTPPISPINQDANTETLLPPPTSSGAAQNKGSSNMVPQSKAASKDLLASRKESQAEFDTYTASITLWESHIAELQKKIADAWAKQTAIKGLDTTEADTLAVQSVEHVERASAMTEDIVRLKSIHTSVQYKLGLAKIKYERMKKNILFLFT